MTIEDGFSSFHIYIHSDGVPEYVLPLIEEATKYAWKFPRFEAGDFATAITKVMKNWAWNIYLTSDAESHFDRDYHYKISKSGLELKIEVEDLR